MLADVQQYIKDHEKDFVDRLNTLLKIPSISTASEHAADTRKACDWVKDQLLAAGIETVVLETEKHPAVFADTGPAEGPTVLVYGHYDVQPPGDLSLWNMPDMALQKDNGYPFGYVIPESGTPILTEGMAIVNGAPHEAIAQHFF